MFSRKVGLAVVLTVLILPIAPARALQEPEESFTGGRIEFDSAPGTAVAVNDRLYPGHIAVAGYSNGLAATEVTTVDNYLAGIREVPTEWHEEALKAQAVAARTYLAWTLVTGRSSNGRIYGYDICGTDACQVYMGIDQRQSGGAPGLEPTLEILRGAALGAKPKSLEETLEGRERADSRREVVTHGGGP